MMRLTLFALILGLVLVAPSPATSASTGVTPHAFRTVPIGATKWEVQHTWDARGRGVRQWLGPRTVWRDEHYPTSQGTGTYVDAIYRLDIARLRWVLDSKAWCVLNDAARTATFTCRHRPYPF